MKILKKIKMLFNFLKLAWQFRKRAKKNLRTRNNKKRRVNPIHRGRKRRY